MKLTDQQLNKIEQFVKSKLDSLNWQHTLQVRKLALTLAIKEKADLAIVEAAALLHDVGKYSAKPNHAGRGAEMARQFLEKEKLEQKLIEEVVYSVICHDYAWDGNLEKFLTIEAKVLADADILNWLSPMGIVKAIYYEDRPIKNNLPVAVKDILNRVDKMAKLLQTKTGKSLVKERIKQVKEFYNTLL